MSTKVTLKSRRQSPDQVGFHLYVDLLDSVGSEDESESPVYLRLEGVAATLHTLDRGGASVLVVLPRALARELGLVPTDASSSTSEDSTR